MNKDKKTEVIDILAQELTATPNFYLVDISGLNAENTSKLRRACFEKEIRMVVVKNTLLKKALEKVGLSDSENLYPILEGPTAIMFTESVNTPAKLIKEYGKQFGKPVLKGALDRKSVV